MINRQRFNRTVRAADLFCGAGGTATGLLEALDMMGYQVELTAINHWPVAIETHYTNHPCHRHLCTGVDDVDPNSLFPDGLDFLWASPECTHHSRARGGKPMKDQSRATAQCVVDWAEKTEPSVIWVENVPEFEDWGPLYKSGPQSRIGKPIPSKKGQTFRKWWKALKDMGYTLEKRVVTCADHGDPTTRKRLFIQAVHKKAGGKCVWPEAMFSKEGDDLQKWRSARECINPDHKGRSVYGRDKPVAYNTMKRVFTGLFRHSLKDFLVPNFGERPGQLPRTHALEDPAPSVTSHGAGQLAEMFLEPFNITIDQQSGRGVYSDKDPLTTVTTKARHCRIEPYIVELSNNQTTKDMDKPLGTVRAGGGHHAYAEPLLNLVLPQHGGGAVRPVDDPLPTVATTGSIQLIEPKLEEIDLEPFLISYYGCSSDHSLDNPVNTVTTKERFGYVQPILKIEGRYYRLDIHLRMLQPDELAAAQGFRRDYKFQGTKTDSVRQIGNAVPRNTARALVLAGVSGQSDLSHYKQEIEELIAS